ncbi:MAG: hypothetical protein ACK50J_13760, partial [Planctomyces sp.]
MCASSISSRTGPQSSDDRWSLSVTSHRETTASALPGKVVLELRSEESDFPAGSPAAAQRVLSRS